VRDDRRVHASGVAAEVVRYDRAGKWYIEAKATDTRRHIGVREAAEWASVAATEIYFGLPGGSAFDRHVKREQTLLA
jgi:hypothetical protein